MAGISWPEGVSNGINSLISNGTNFLISSVINSSSGDSLGADLQHSNGTNSLISNGTNSLISSVINSSSGGVLGADLQHSNGTNFIISNGTNSLISSVLNSSSGGILGADLQHSNGTNFIISNGTNSLISSVLNSSSGGVLGADLQHSNGTDFPILNGTDSLISNVLNSSSGGVLGADLQHSLLAVTYSVVLVLGLAGSALSLSLSLCRAKPLSHSFVLLLQLALLDALFLAVLPLQIHSQLLGGTWSFGDTACRVSRALFHLHGSLSVALLTCLAVDAWLAALHPLTSVQLRACRYALLATALWLLALGGSVPLLLRSAGLRSCFGGFPGSWAHPTAPLSILALVFGGFLPLSLTLLGLPLAARGVWRGGRGAARRRALGTFCIVLSICALCFVPQQLSQLLQFLQGVQQEPLPGLQRVSEALASCSCCLKPLLYRFHSSSSPWRCPCRLRSRAKRVFTISDHNFGDPSWGCKPGQRRGEENPRGWNQLSCSRCTQS